jgi:creatinine amidohydrolase
VKSLFDLPHAEAKALVERGEPVYLPVNPVEYHGPHLSLLNDHFVSMGIVRDLHARLARDPSVEPLVAPELGIGVDPCPGRGTRATPFREALTLVREAVRALCELGARKIVFVTFHGAPLHGVVLDEGIEECRRHGARGVSPLALVMTRMLELDDPGRFAAAVAHVSDARTRDELMRRMPLDFHAGFLETSLALHYAPHTVSPIHRALAPCPEPTPDAGLLTLSRAMRRLGRHGWARELAFVAEGKGWYALRPFPGYTSAPALATAEAGAVFAAMLADETAPVVRDVLYEGAEPPRPILRWLRAVTLDGRVPVTEVRLDQIAAIAGS